MTPKEIRDIRERLGLTQEGFAREIGVSFATVNRWERGHMAPNGLSLKALQQMEKKASKVLAQ